MSTTHALKGQSEADLTVKTYESFEDGHEGVFEVKSAKTPGTAFIVKFNYRFDETPVLWKVQNSFAAHPECLKRKDLGLPRVASDEEIEHFPKFAPFLDAAKVHLRKPIRRAGQESNNS